MGFSRQLWVVMGSGGLPWQVVDHLGKWSTVTGSDGPPLICWTAMARGGQIWVVVDGH